MDKKLFYLLCLIFISIIFFSFSVDSILINRFNNSLSSENLTFFGKENITRYLEIPKYANVTSAYMNLSGYGYENWTDSIHVANPSFETGQSWTYGETDVDFSGEYSTAWSTQGSRSYKLYAPSPSYWVNGYSHNKIVQTIDFDNITKMRFDWNLKGAMNRFDFQMLVGETVKWEPAYTDPSSGTTIIDVSDETGNQALGFKLLHNYPSAESYTPEVYFFIDNIEETIYLYPQNSSLKIGTPNGSYEWHHAGEFSSMEKTPDFSSTLNTALNSGTCNCVDCFLNITTNNCIIPFLFHSDTAGKLEYSNINISYDLIYPPTLENYWYGPLYPSSLSLGTIFANFSDPDGVDTVQIKYYYHYVKGSKNGTEEQGDWAVMDYLGGNIWKHNLTITPAPDNDGFFKIRFRANDTLNIEKDYPSKSGWQLYISFDDTAPKTTININEGDYITSSTEIILTATDTDLDGSKNYIPSGVNFTAYKINEGEPKNYSGSFNIPGEDGTYTIEYYSIDNAENKEKNKTVNIFLDNTAPITTSNFTLNEGQNSDIMIELSCGDPLINGVASGCDITHYCIDEDDTCMPLEIYSQPIIYGEEGIHYLRFRSQDVAGNWEEIKSQIIKLDKLGPSIKITSPKDNYNLTGDVEIFVNISDELSGVENVSYELRNLTYVFKKGNLNYDNVTGKYRGVLKDVLRDIPVGTYTLEVTATDNVGNEATDNITIKAIEFILADITPIISNVPFGENSIVKFDINFTIRGGNAIRMKISDLNNNERTIYTPEQLNARLVYNGTEYPVRNNYIGDKIILPSTPAGASGNVKFKMDIKSYMVPGNYHADYQFEITWA